MFLFHLKLSGHNKLRSLELKDHVHFHEDQDGQNHRIVTDQSTELQ